MRNLKANKGITLIALAITIIVLLILAGVTISLVLGQNGIIGKAQKTQSETDISVGRDQVQLALSSVVADKLTLGKNASDITAEELQEELRNTDSLASVNIGEGNQTFKVKYHVNAKEYMYVIDIDKQTVKELLTGNEEIVEPIENVPESWINTTKASWGYSYKDMSSNSQTEVAVNEPNLTSEMTPIKYVAGSTTGLEEGSKWANAMTPDGSMWVWIPRYAYKITKGYHGNGLTYDSNNVTTEAGTIEIAFIDTQNRFLNSSDTGEIKTNPSEITYTNNVQNEWLVHPTFTTNADNGGGWRQELEGIWVAKFEASGSTSKVEVKPNVQSLRSTKIGDMWTIAQNATFGTIETKDSLNSHMMKNSEWGATAYLAHSKYGRNGTEISINNSSDFYTGRSAGKPGDDSTNNSESYEYNTIQGVLASTTGNVYGIYDMSGGTWEYVAAYVNNGNSSLNIYGSSFTTTNTSKAISNEYVTVYSKGSLDNIESNYNSNLKAKGDAMYETSLIGKNRCV